jgi:hypothetical protein
LLPQFWCQCRGAIGLNHNPVILHPEPLSFIGKTVFLKGFRSAESIRTRARSSDHRLAAPGVWMERI